MPTSFATRSPRSSTRSTVASSSTPVRPTTLSQWRARSRATSCWCGNFRGATISLQPEISRSRLPRTPVRAGRSRWTPTSAWSSPPMRRCASAWRSTRAKVLLVAQADGSYAKERIVRLPTKVRWNGPTHEALLGQRSGESEVLQGVQFEELPKDARTPAAQIRARRRDPAAARAGESRGSTLALLPWRFAARPVPLRGGDRGLPSLCRAAGVGGRRGLGMFPRGPVPQ